MLALRASEEVATFIDWHLVLAVLANSRVFLLAIRKMSISPSSPNFLPSPTSRLPDFVLNRVVAEVTEICAPGWNWSAVVHTLACTLQMNKVELAVWMQVLRKALLGEREEWHLRTVQFSAYLSKSALNPTNTDAAWQAQSAIFLSNYKSWLLTHSHCTQVSNRQLHLQFLRLSLIPTAQVQPTYNLMVNSIVQEESQKKAVEEGHEEPVQTVERLRIEAFPVAETMGLAPMLPNFLR